MKNKNVLNYFLILMLLFSTFLSAQEFRMSSYNSGWIPVNSSAGVTIKDFLKIQLDIQSRTDYKNWSIVARVVSPIKNADNKEFPVNKLKFKFGNYTTQQYYSKTYPTTAQLGAVQGDIAMNFTRSYFIKNSQVSTNTNGEYGNILLNYDLIIEGGSYLNDLKSWNNYNIQLELTLLDGFSNVISSVVTNTFSMQISPQGNYPNTSSFSISVDGSATNGELVFSTMSDYINGVRKEYINGLNVSSDTPCEIQVSSQNAYLSTSSSDNLDLNSVRVQLRDTETNKLSNEVKLSTYNQTLLTSSKAISAKKYTIIYSTAASDQKIMNSKSGNYSTTLLYTISPQ